MFQLDRLELLPALYGQITVPAAVVRELERGQAQGLVLPVVTDFSWAAVKKARHPILLPLAGGLGAGEAEVLALAQEATDSLAVLDDKRARQYARVLGISFTGTLGILLKAKQAGTLLELRPVLERLQALGFRIHPDTYKATLQLAQEHP